MSKLKIGFIGTGHRAKQPGHMGYAMAYQHAEAYQDLESCELIACADIKPENAQAFADHYQLPNMYLSHAEMLEKEDLDIVSVCVWPKLHAQMVFDCVSAGVRAIHCEKPMADNWADARLMVEQCRASGIQLTFNHQRRFGLPFAKAKELLKNGEIGSLQRLEAACGDIFDYGTHYIDMFGFYNDDLSAKWVIGQIDYRKENLVFGAVVENQAIGYWEYENGVFGLIATGVGAKGIGAHNRLIGTDGMIEVGATDGSHLRIMRKNSSIWEIIDTNGENLHGPNYIFRAIDNLVGSLENGVVPELDGKRALQATEIIFACYESSRRHARIDLPLTIDDNPLVSMIENGDLISEV